MKNSKSYSVLGLSKFGYRVATSLYNQGAQVIAVDIDQRNIQRVSASVSKAVCANLTDWDVLENMGVFNADTAVIGLRTSFDVSVLLIHYIRNNTQVKTIIAQADSNEKVEALRVIGADLVVFPERDSADQVVRRLIMPNLVDQIPLSSDTSIIEVPVPLAYDQKTIIDLQIRSKYKVYVVGIKRQQSPGKPDKVVIAPSPRELLKAGDTLLVLGAVENLSRFTDSL